MGTSMAAQVDEVVEKEVEGSRPRPRSLGVGASGHRDIGAIVRVWERRKGAGGSRIPEQVEVLRHFTARFERLYGSP